MSYVRANTQPNVGWRPNVRRLGEVRPVKPRRIYRRFFGDDTQPVSYDWVYQETGIPVQQQPGPSEDDLRNQLTSLTDKFVQANKAITDEDSVIAANPGVFSQQVLQQHMQNRLDFESLWGKYVTAYRLVFGTTPASSLGSLGIDPATAVIVAAAITAIFAGLYLLSQHLANNNAQIQVELQQAKNQSALTGQAASIQQQITDAQARGDTAAVQSLQQQYAAVLKSIGNAGGNQNTLTAWFQNNWGWLAVSAAGLMALNKL